MKVGIVGLGLIGGSLAKAVKKYTDCEVHGEDQSAPVLAAALADGTIDAAGCAAGCDIVFICLYPDDTVHYLLQADFSPGTIVADTCGVKRFVAERVSHTLHQKGVFYVGSHPMAGREKSGYAAASAVLFCGASFIITEDAYTNREAAQRLGELARQIGFSSVTWTTPEEHDKIIAYTSQLAHVVSNCYVKNRAAARENGFSAGSFQDLTRVARLNSDLWTELFLENADFLTADIDELLVHMKQMRDAIAEGNGTELRKLLQDGSDRKEKLSR